MYIELDLLEEAHAIFSDMLEGGVVPSVNTYRPFIVKFLERDEHEQAHVFLQDARDRGVVFTTKMREWMVEAYSRLLAASSQGNKDRSVAPGEKERKIKSCNYQ